MVREMLPVIGIENSGVSLLALYVYYCDHPCFSAQAYPMGSSGKQSFVSLPQCKVYDIHHKRDAPNPKNISVNLYST